ncbi:hypothetical protein P8H29_23765, partial [Pandoraea communis]|nr:hypothetical protein [Pandoraea communis]
MRHLLIAATVLLCPVISAQAQVQVGVSITSPGVSIGIDLPAYPTLVQVPSYPVYYAPQLDSNYFFYEGQYWVYQGDNWYTSAWYNGPWQVVLPTAVPVFILRIPVRYYRRPALRAQHNGDPSRTGQNPGPGGSHNGLTAPQAPREPRANGQPSEHMQWDQQSQQGHQRMQQPEPPRQSQMGL